MMGKVGPASATDKIFSEALVLSSEWFSFGTCCHLVLPEDVTEYTFPDFLLLDEHLKISCPLIPSPKDEKISRNYSDFRRHLVT